MAKGVLESLSPQENIDAIYIAYYGRAPDNNGYDFWVNQYEKALSQGQTTAQALTNIANSFAPQAETSKLYPFLTSPDPDNPGFYLVNKLEDNAGTRKDLVALIQDIYRNEFGRDVTNAELNTPGQGVQYWVDEILVRKSDLGKIALLIANGATGRDAVAIQNKIEVAGNFESRTEAAGIGDQAAEVDKEFLDAATNAVAGVTYDRSTVEIGNEKIDEFIESSTPTPSIVQLSADQDIKSGNIFNAPLANQGGNQVQTLNSSDILTGSGTNAVLNAVLNGSEAGGTKATISGVSSINLTSVGNAAHVFDASNVDGATSFTSISSKAGLTISDIKNAALVGINNLQAGDFDHTFKFANEIVSSSSDEVTLKLDGAGVEASGVTGIDISITGQTSGGFESIIVNSSGSSSRIDSLTSSSGGINFLKSLTVKGDGDLRIDKELLGVVDLDAQAFTGDLHISLDTSKNVKVTGGEGAEFLNFSSGLNNKDDVNGGMGRDTLAVEDSIGLGIGNQIKSVETIQFNGANENIFDQNNVQSVDSVIQNSLNQLTINNFDSVSGTNYTKGIQILNTGLVTVNVEGSASSIADVLNITFGKEGKLDDGVSSELQTNIGADAGGLTAQNVETININVLADANGQTATGTGHIEAQAIKTITIEGGSIGESFSLNEGSNQYGLDSAINKIDAHSFIGDLRDGDGVSLVNAGITGDIAGEVIIAGSGDDVIRDGGRGGIGTLGDKITGGSGDDVFAFADTVSSTGLQNGNVANGAFTADQLSHFTTITDLDLGGATSFADRINLGGTFDFGGVAGQEATVVSGNPTVMLGGTFEDAVSSLIANGGVLNLGAGALSGSSLKVGLFTYNNDIFLIANEADGNATGYVANDTVVIDLGNSTTGSFSGVLDKGDILLI